MARAARARHDPGVPFITDPLFWALAIPAFVVNGISKGGFASGAGNVSVPLMAMTMPVPQAAGVALPVLCVMDIAGLRAWWGRWSVREMRTILPGGMVGVVLGALAFGLLPPKVVALMLGIITLLFLARSLWTRRGGRVPEAAAPDRMRGTFWSAVSGLTSTVAHAGGPPMAIYLYPLRLDRATLVATTTVFFATLNYAKLLPYWGLGVLNLTNLLTSVALLPAAIAGVYLGIWLQTRITDRVFYNAVYVLLAFSGSKLVWDGLS